MTDAKCSSIRPRPTGTIPRSWNTGRGKPTANFGGFPGCRGESSLGAETIGDRAQSVTDTAFRHEADDPTSGSGEGQGTVLMREPRCAEVPEGLAGTGRRGDRQRMRSRALRRRILSSARFPYRLSLSRSGSRIRKDPGRMLKSRSRNRPRAGRRARPVVGQQTLF